MLIVTSDHIQGKSIDETLGIVKGNTIRAKHIGKDIVAGFRGLIGGEVKEYTEMLNEARDEAMKRMKNNAKEMGADAVINMRFSTSMVMGGAAEMLAYGTAVKLK
jgi:uncharacterized protein YbjQ (UPF0145 family)